MIVSTRVLTTGRQAVLAAIMTMSWMTLTNHASAVAGEKGTDATASRDVRYVTADAMYLANEEWYLYSCSLPGNQTDVGSNFDEDSYWYSRYNLGNLLFRSGMGIHLVHNPLFKHHVAQDHRPDGTPMWKSPKEFMEFKIRQFCARTGVPCRLDPENQDNPKAFPPKGAFPVFLEFASGSPRFTQAPVPDNFNTLRWAPDSFDTSIVPAALGQTLLKQVLWSEDFFAEHREGPKGQILFGNENGMYGDGFRGAALTAEAISKMFTLKTSLAYDPAAGRLGDVDPMTYDPAKGLRYYAHAVQPKLMQKPGMPPMPVAWNVVDPSSHLADQASLLWGTSEFYYYSDPTIKDSFDSLFGDQGDHRTGGALFPLEPHMLSKGLSVVAFKNMMAMHFDKEHGTFRGVVEPRSSGGMGRVVLVSAPQVNIQIGRRVVGVAHQGDALSVLQERDGWLGVRKHHADQSTGCGWVRPSQVVDINTADAGLALTALANLHDRLHDAPAPLLQKVQMAIAAQATFVRDHLTAPDGGLYNGYTFGIGAQQSPRQLVSQGLGIRGLLAAYKVTRDASFKKAAEQAYAYLNDKLWSATAKSYRSEEGALVSTYTPRNVGATLGALRELALVASDSDRTPIVSRIDQFFAATQTQHRMQLAEIDPTGETIPPMEKVKAMKAQLMSLMKTDPKKAQAMKTKMADSDSDGIPKPGMAGGEFGFAPVPALAVKVATQ